MGNKQTALQFFLTGLVDLEIGKNVPTDKVRQLHDLFNQAKQMEKQQIIESFKHGEMPKLFSNLSAEQYYNEEYGGNKWIINKVLKIK